MKKSFIKLGLIVFFMSTVLMCAHLNKDIFIALLESVHSYYGLSAVVILSILYLLSNLLVLPFGLPITMLAGLLWGTWNGGLLINILATLVAAVSFYIGRYFGNYLLKGFFSKYPQVHLFTSTVNRYDWQYVSLMRINPIVPFGLSNYLFGMIPDLSFKHYIISTALSNMLPTFIFTSMGSLFKTISIATTDARKLILEVGIILFLATLVFTQRIIAVSRSK